VTLDNAKFSHVWCNSAANCQIVIKNNPVNPLLPDCGTIGTAGISYIDCGSATNCAISILNSSPINTVVNCKTTCVNTFSNLPAEKSGTFNSKYLYVNCVGT
jgi:hypothetical protein